ncbi:hypothetical protein EHQ76_08665 [Leptospira barantonii]|uniref:Uncharacterized protein n=1 Tax=Leptospira barantonii TaxID=2023184 RepID=A0A5F2BDQ5_9LEPT|nr:hypothetical protein EHQ76_08665 [Leptospira barantonii]
MNKFLISRRDNPHFQSNFSKNLEVSPENGPTGGCILLENGRGLKNQGGIVKILEKGGKFVVK